MTNFGIIRERIQTRLSNQNIGPKLLLYILVPLIILLLMLSAGFYLYSTYFLEKRANLSLFSQSGAISNEIQHYIKNAEGDLGALLTNRMIMDYSMYSEIGLLDYAEDARWKVEKDFLRIVEEKPEYATIRIIGLDGKSVVDVIDRKISYRHFNFSKEDWFVNTLKLEDIHSYISPLHLCTEHQKPGILISRLYYDDAGRKKGVGSLHIHVGEYFSELLEKTIGENGYIYLVNKDGIIVGHKDRSKIGENIKDFKSTQNVLAGNRGAITEIDENNKVLMKKAYIPLKIDGLNLVVSQPMSEIRAVARRFILFNLIILIATVSIVSVITYIAIRRFTKPIIEIQDAVAEIAGGNLTKTINIEAPIPKCWEIMKCEKKNCPAYLNNRIPCWFVAGTFCYGTIQGNYAKKIGDCIKCIVHKKFKGDEIQKLRIGFNEMAIKLKKSYTILEEEVKERTKKLEKEIFERKKAEEDLIRSNADIEAVNRELDSFVYTASHDLKEPLRSMHSFSRFILDDYWDKLDDEGKDYLKRIVAGSSRMKNLIDGMLAFSRITRSKEKLYESIDIHELVREALKRLEPIVEERGVKLKIRDDLPFVYGNKTKLTEVFYNLISNSIKYNDKESPIVEIDCPIPQPKKDEAVVYVKDNGIGIRKEYYDEIFKIFRRLHSHDEYGGGTGAGLAIVKRIIDDHNGKIWIESKVGEGTKFHINFPKGGKS